MILNNPNLSTLVNRSLSKCTVIKRRANLICPIISKQELLCRFSQEYLPLAEREILPKNYSCADSLSGVATPSAAAPISSLSTPSFPPPPEPQPQQVPSHPPPTRRRSSYSRPPAFPAIQEKEEETDAALLVTPTRPTTLNLNPKPSTPPLEAKHRSLIPRHKPGVLVTSRAVAMGVRKVQTGESMAKKVASPPRNHPLKKKPVKGAPRLQQFTESSFDADDEDAAAQSPLQSQYPLSTWSVSRTDSDSSPPLRTKGGSERMTPVGEVLEMKAVAEVHHQPRQPSLKEFHVQETLPNSPDSSHATTSPAALAAVSLVASQSSSSTPRRRRPKLRRSDVIDTDEVTGQLREDSPLTVVLPDLQESATLPLETAKRMYKSCLQESSFFTSPSHPNPESDGDDDGDDV